MNVTSYGDARLKQNCESTTNSAKVVCGCSRVGWQADSERGSLNGDEIRPSKQEKEEQKNIVDASTKEMDGRGVAPSQ